MMCVCSGWWVAHSRASLQHAIDAHDSPSVNPDAGTAAAATAPVTHHIPQRDAAQGSSHQGLLPSALDRCLVPVRVQMLGKGNAHAAAAILAHAVPQQESRTSPPRKSLPVGSRQSGTKSQLCSRPEYKLESQSQSLDLLQHSQHLQAGGSQTLKGISAMAEGASSQASQQNKHQAGLSGHDHLSIDQSAFQDDFGGAERVKMDRYACSDTLLGRDKHMLAMEHDIDDCDDDNDDEEDVHASEQLQLQQPASSTANEAEEESEKQHEEEGEEGPPHDGQLRPSVIGFVTSEAPRGLSGETGARALCSVTALRQLYREQVQAQTLRNSRHGILVQVKVSGSSQCWKAALHWTGREPWHRILLPVKQNVK